VAEGSPLPEGPYCPPPSEARAAAQARDPEYLVPRSSKGAGGG